MRKALAIALVVIAVAVVCFLAFSTPMFVFQSVTTDKNSYSSGEKITVSYSNFGFGQLCTCGPYLGIYQLVNGKWEGIFLHEPSNFECINDTVVGSQDMGCDVIQCAPSMVNEKKSFEWDAKIFTEETKICGSRTYMHYEKISAPAGMYKAGYGMAETIFSIG